MGTLTESQPRVGGRSIKRKILIAILAIFVVFVVVSVVAAYLSAPYVKKLAFQTLMEKFHAEIQVSDFHVWVWPMLRIEGTNLSLRQGGRTDVPPEIMIAEFSAQASPFSVLKRPWKIDRIQLKGMKITIAHRVQNKPGIPWAKLKDVPIIIGELNADGTELDIVPKSAEKPHHIFEIHHLVMNRVGLHHPAVFIAQLTNPTPPGNIDSRGVFGPWNSDDPGETPLSADYTFMNADLGVFKGISGILSSHGKYAGVLNRIEVEGETDTPDFMVAVGGHPVRLQTTFSATVDGLNGNTLLHPVRAHFLNSTIIADGEVAKHPGAKGRCIVLNINTNQARLQDLLRLAVKSEPPPMTGDTSLRAKFDLPPGAGDLIERLRLNGIFKVQGGTFTNPAISSKVQSLSRKGLGKPGDQNAGSDVLSLQGNFKLGSGVIDFSHLAFSVPGASVKVSGNYGLEDEKLDFRGKLWLDAKLSQTMTGVKSFLLKPVDPFFRKNNQTEIPIKVTGTRSAPAFGLDLHDKRGQTESKDPGLTR